MEFEWSISQDSPYCSSSSKSQSSSATQGRILLMSMFNDITWGTEDNEKECIANATLVSLFAKRFPADCWSFTPTDHEETGTESLN